MNVVFRGGWRALRTSVQSAASIRAMKKICDDGNITIAVADRNARHGLRSQGIPFPAAEQSTLPWRG